MQLLTFTVVGQCYAIASRTVVEVLPLVTPRPIPHLPDYVPGVFMYRGQFVPLVDLGLRIGGRPLTRRLSTRVIVVDVAVDHGAADHAADGGRERLVRFGIMAENVVSIRSSNGSGGEGATKQLAADAYLGQLLRLDGQTVQMLLPEHVIPHDLLTRLFPERFQDDHAEDRLEAVRT